MKVNYTLTQEDMEKIIADYMKEKYNLNKPDVRIVKEEHEDYYDQDNKIEVIVAYVSEW